MTAIHGYSTAYSNLADSNIPNPIDYTKFWIIPEIFDSKRPTTTIGLPESNIQDKASGGGYETMGTISRRPTPQNEAQYMKNKIKDLMNISKDQTNYYKSKRLTNTIVDVIASRPDTQIFNKMLQMFPTVYSQMSEYKGSAFVFVDGTPQVLSETRFTGSNATRHANDLGDPIVLQQATGAQTLTLNKYDTFQLENLMRYHTSKTILPYDQLKNRKLRVHTLLDNQFLMINNPPLREMVSQDPKLQDCVILTPNNRSAAGDSVGGFAETKGWTKTDQILQQGKFEVYVDQNTEKRGKILEIIECDNGIVYIIDGPLDLSYYQF